MRHNIKNITLFSIACILGVLLAVQIISLQKSSYSFQENNILRSIRVDLEATQAQESFIQEKAAHVQSLRTQSQIQENARKQIQKAQSVSGESIENTPLNLLLEGEVSIDTLIKLTQILWENGAKNMYINGTPFSLQNSGFDQAGGQIIFGSTPISSPFLFQIEGPADDILQAINTENGALKTFVNNSLHITLSLSK